MEEWEQLLESYPEAPDLKVFIKMLKTADVVLKQDLATFESGWIINTLFFKPVNLLDTISSKLNETAWNKPISDALKLISSIVEKYSPDHLYENIVTLCLLPYSPQIRKDALTCLTLVVRVSNEGAREAQRLIAELEDITTSKAQMAVLVGAICEHHPEVVSDSATRIWRIYLNLLDSNKNTDTVISAVLQGLLGLFKHFGTELPLMEFRDLYDKVSRQYLMKKKCEEACLSLFEHHSSLFKELLSQDHRVRKELWSLRASAALRAVYAAVADGGDQTKKIAETELIPRASSHTASVKYTALRILRQLRIDYRAIDATDALGLAREVRRGRVTIDTALAIQWCIESNSLYSDKLLQTVVLFYNNIPVSKRREVVVHGLLNASDDVREITTTLLLTESCQDGIDQWLPLWKDLFDSRGGSDVTVLQKGRHVLGDVIACAQVMIEAAVESEEMPPTLSALLTVVYHILTIHPLEDYTESLCCELLKLLVRCGQQCGLSAGLVSAGIAAHRHCGGSLKELCGMVRIDKCGDEALLCECCHLLVYAPKCDVTNDDVLTAVEILLTRRDVEPAILSLALQRMEDNLNGQSDLDVKRLDKILCLIEKLRTRKDVSNKEARILHRDVILFLGKYGNNNYISTDLDENTLISELKDKLILNVPNPEEGSTYKINLQSVLQLAISHEDPDALQKLLSVICATLSTNRDPNLQLSLTLVIRALCRAYARTSSVDAGSIQQAVLLCDNVACLRALMKYISEEKSPGVRKMLSDALEGLLLKDPGSDATEQLVRVAGEHAGVMMASPDPIVSSGGVYITETLLSALKDNHLLQTKELPNILKLILETEDLDSKKTFQTAYKILLENLEIYPKETLDSIGEKLSKNLLNNSLDLTQEDERRFYKEKTKITLQFLKEINFDSTKLLGFCKMIDSNFDLKVYLFASCREHGWTVNDAVLEEVLVKVKSLECTDVFVIEAVLKFLEVYSMEIVEKKKEMTLQGMENILKNIAPEILLQLTKQFKSCMAVYSTLEMSDMINNSHKMWYEKYEYDSIIENNYILSGWRDIENSKLIKALDIYLETAKIPFDECDVKILNLLNITLEIYVENGEKYIEPHKEFLSNILNMSLRYKSLTEIKEFVLKTFKTAGIGFLRYFLRNFEKYILERPYIMLEDDMKPVSVILNDVMNHFMKKKYTEDDCIKMLQFVDALWPTYEPASTFQDKHLLLAQSARLPVQLGGDSAAMRWAAALVAGGARGEGVKLVSVLPGGEVCSSAYRAFASQLPARLSELSGVEHAALQAVLDATASSADRFLLDVVMKLADCDQTEGWWDEAMASCMAVIARRGDCTLTGVRGAHGAEGGCELIKRKVEVMSIAKTLYEYPSLGVCKRLLIPLLRYSPSSFCEEFYSIIINSLLSTLVRWVRGSDRHNQELRAVLKEHARSLALITLALEKIPLSSLKSPDSKLYSEVAQKQPSYLMRKTSSICVTLRKKPCPEGASAELRECYRQAQVENYKCLCAAVCVSRPSSKFYDLLFEANVWEAVFDCEKKWELPLKAQWAQATTVRTVADASPGLRSAESSTSGTRTRMFLRTLSENPLQFDLMDAGEEPTVNAQELELVINELNSQEGADTLTALLRHVAALDHHEWRGKVAETLVGDCHRNVKWTLAQMICNCKDELKPHAAALAPPLFAMIAVTPREVNGRKLVNNLHVDVLETILHWGYIQADSTNVSTAVEYLIATAIDNAYHSSALATLLGKILGVYGKEVSVSWSSFEQFLTVPEKMKTILKLLIIIAKNKIHIPELLPALLQLDESVWARDVRLAELLGLALACASETGRATTQYRHLLDRKRQRDVGEYVKMLYYAQLGFPSVCDEYNFKKIIDLTSKVPGPIKSKCLLIISTYVTHSPSEGGALDALHPPSLLAEAPAQALRVMLARRRRGDLAPVLAFCEAGEGDIRALACRVVLRWFEDFFGPPQGEPPSKRPKHNASRLLSAMDSSDPLAARVLACAGAAATDSDPGIAEEARESVAGCLSGDMGVRLAEAYLIAVSVPATSTNKNRSLSVCASAFLDLLFRGLRAQERFKEAKLREEPLELSDPSVMTSKLLSNTRTYQGTFLSTMGKRPRATQGPVSSGINVQVPIDEILGALLAFAKDKSDVSQALCVAITAAIISGPPSPAPPGLGAALGAEGPVASLAAQLARADMGELVRVPDFDSTLQKLRKKTRGTEGENLVQLLYEESRMLTDMELFELGTVFEDDGNIMEVDTVTSSLEDITSAFGKLSCWDHLTEQRKKEVTRGLPQVWVPEETFAAWLADYQVTNTKTWLNRLVSACRGECERDSLRWLRETDRWPRRHFDISVVTECIERYNWSENEVRETCDIRPVDCLVEWAARLMIRRSATTADDSMTTDTAVNRTNELSWCQVALQRGLPQLALNCVEVNGSSVDPSEYLPWKIVKADAMRQIGLCNEDTDILADALAILENNEHHLEGSVATDIIAMNQLRLALHEDMNCLSEEVIKNIMETTNSYAKNETHSTKNKDMLFSIYEIAINFYDQEWANDPPTQNRQLTSIAEYIGHVVDLGLYAKAEMCLSVVFNRLDDVTGAYPPTQNRQLTSIAEYIGHVVDLGLYAKAEMCLSVVFNRLDDVTGVLEEGAARCLLEKLSLLIDKLDDTSLEQVATHSHLFPAKMLRSYPTVAEALSPGDRRQEIVQQLKLVCDARHALLRCCHALATHVADAAAWSSTFAMMRDSILDNPYSSSSTEYTVLNKYTNELELIEDYESTDTKQKTSVLNKIILELRKKTTPRTTLRLSQLCPALAKYSYSGSERDGCMSRLLRIGKLGVVKFYEQVTVFSDAVTRPAVLQALLTDGSTRRYIHKTGDRLRLDASAGRVAGGAGEWGAHVVTYAVTPLGEYSGLIEYVENTTRLRDMINSKFDLGDVDIGARAEDEELILASSSLQHHQSFCRQVPAHALRSAIQTYCSSTEDFINKKRMFLETLSSVTLFSWLFGLGDRHLENILYSIRDGGVCCVDWSAMFQYGVRELPPARLTRNIVAVCDLELLEARLQALVKSLRKSNKLFLSVMKVSFKWMGEEFFSKFPYIEAYALGRSTSRDVSRQVLLSSDRRHKERLAKLVNDTFQDLPERERYTVVEQVTCLLRQCTDPKILSVTRSGWEPWV